MKIIFILSLLFNLFHVYCFDLNKKDEGVFSEKYPNSNKSMIYEAGYLYSVNERSLIVFKVADSKIVKISELELEGKLNSIHILEQLLFVTTSFPVNRVYKIDISSVNKPFTLDTLNIPGSYTGFIYQQYYCVNELNKNNTWTFRLFEIEDFAEISSIKVPHSYWPVKKLNAELLIVTANEFMEIYTLNEGKLYSVAKDFASDLSSPNKSYILKDSIFIHSCAINGLSIYNIKNPFYWKTITNIKLPITNFEVLDKCLIVLNGSHQIRFYDICNLRNPTITDSLTIEENIRDLIFCDNNIFISCKEGKIYNLELIQNKIISQSESSHYGYLKDAILHKNNLTLNTALGFTIQAQIVENEIRILNENKDNLRKKYLRNDKDNFISYGLLKNSDATKTDIGQILTNGVNYYKKDVYNLPDNVTVFDNYLIYLNMGYIRIFNLEDSLSLSAEMRFSETRNGRFYFYKDHIFLMGNENGFVFGFDESNSNIYLKGEFHTYNNYYANVAFYNNYMFISQTKGGRNCDVYDITDVTQIEIFEVIDHTGTITVDSGQDLLFMGDHSCKIYDIKNIDNHDLKFLTTVNNHRPIVKLFTLQKKNKNYLLLVGETSVSLYSYHL